MDSPLPPGDSPGKAKPPSSEILDAALDLWAQGGSSHLVPVSGTSMLPLLRQGDFLLVAHKAKEIALGEILVFQGERGLVAHRVIEMVSRECDQMGYITKGDNSDSLDPVVPQEAVVGRVQSIRRGGREISVDNRLWKGFGRLVAAEMRLLVGFPGRNGESQPGRSTRLWRGGFRRIVALQLKIFEILFGP